MKKMRIIAISNQKGGVGKTSTAQNIGAGLFFTKFKVLLVDLDPQGNLTIASGIEAPEKTIAGVLNDETPIQEAIVKTSTYDLIPADFHLNGIQRNPDDIGQEFKLMEELQKVKKLYDIIIIDCPPDLHLLTVMALTAADSVLIPMQPKHFSKIGLDQLMLTIDVVHNRLNRHLKIAGILFTLYDSRIKASETIMQEVREKYSDYVMESKIRVNTAIDKAQQAGQDIFTYDSCSNAANDYVDTIKELLADKRI